MEMSGVRGAYHLAGTVAAAMTLVLLSACIPGRQSAGGAVQDAPAPPRLETDSSILQENSAPPTWETRTVTASAVRISAGSYTVQPNDTLRSIGESTGAGAEVLAQANNITPPFTIFPGQRLAIPGGLYHRVGQGETGIAIARAYAVPWSEIVVVNGLSEPYILRIGQRLLLPADSATLASPASLKERAAAFDIGIDDIVSGGQPALAEGSRAAKPSKAAIAAPNSKAIATPKTFDGKFAWPLNGKLTSTFGSKGGGKVNNGIDIGIPIGTPIKAAADGVVSYSGDEIAVYGGLILISHGSGWVTAYGYADRLDVVRGQAVKAGQVIGMSGDSGHASEPQLHFEIRKALKPVNPALYLPVK